MIKKLITVSSIHKKLNIDYTLHDYHIISLETRIGVGPDCNTQKNIKYRLPRKQIVKAVSRLTVRYSIVYYVFNYTSDY